ncbi:histone H2B [Senna tora]|uniref:Histone H2B n=1 Tax=Senna tora TaxID=362788 RepID=A0A834W1I7_9FABA|nr:histone H2B [Senna tora]
MAPKRGKKIVVKSTRKVVQETIQVSVVSSSKRPSRDTQKDEEGNSSISQEDVIRTIPVEEVKAQAQAPVENDEKQEKKKGMKRKRKRGGGEGYRRYVYKVLKQVHPEMGISFQAMTILNNLMSDMFERLADEATKLKKYTGHMTLSSREIQGAVKLVLPGELGRHAIAEGAKAVSNYMSNHAPS